MNFGFNEFPLNGKLHDFDKSRPHPPSAPSPDIWVRVNIEKTGARSALRILAPVFSNYHPPFSHGGRRGRGGMGGTIYSFFERNFNNRCLDFSMQSRNLRCDRINNLIPGDHALLRLISAFEFKLTLLESATANR